MGKLGGGELRIGDGGVVAEVGGGGDVGLESDEGSGIWSRSGREAASGTVRDEDTISVGLMELPRPKTLLAERCFSSEDLEEVGVAIDAIRKITKPENLMPWRLKGLHQV